MSSIISAGAKAVLIEVAWTGAADYYVIAGVRKNGSSVERKRTYRFIQYNGKALLIAVPDENRIVEIYSDNNTSLAFRVVGAF